MASLTSAVPFGVFLRPTAELRVVKDEHGQVMTCRLWVGLDTDGRPVRAFVAAIGFDGGDDETYLRYLKSIEIEEGADLVKRRSKK
jgi:hypothetical protein